MSGYRLDGNAGRWIARGQPLQMLIHGRSVSGFAGDSVASAWIASGKMMIARSFKLHRPRGVFSCGPEEPNALLDVGQGALRTPNTRATEVEASAGLVATAGNAWPSLQFDIAALNAKFAALLPAGFYYKTFMWPHWHWFEPSIRRMAGLGHAAVAADPERYDEVSRQVEVLVVGGGAAGAQAALAAARAGAQVLLLEASPHAVDAAALAAVGVECHTRTTVVGLYDHGLAAALQTVGGAIRERLWKIRARRIVIATGAFERPMLFPDNDRPGVMLASAVAQYAQRYGVACGRRIVITTACDSGYQTAHTLKAAGIEVVAIVDVRERSDAALPEGVPVHRGHAIVAVAGTRAVRAVTIAPQAGGALHTIDADCIASAGGWSPAVNLFSMAGGKLRWDDVASMFVPVGAITGIELVGACAGDFDVGPVPANNAPSSAALMSLGRQPGKIFVDLQNDVSSSDVELAARENYRSVEHLKRYTTMGMATDQGKTSNVNALVLMGSHTQRSPGQVGTTKFRPPFKPVTLNTIAGGRSGARFKPLKHMPGQGWHLERGALMEEFGGWWRPAAYPLPGESLGDAAQREALQVREHVGIFEASPLGKIEIIGPDAAAFLDLMYVGTMSTLPQGGARYGLLINENGVIFDDGIVARLGPEHFWVNTTSGGAERVALAFEEWLQCEYVQHRVWVAPVTSRWGNVTVSGPLAWQLLRAVGFDAALAPTAMKHMTMRECHYGGVPMRVLRASFAGELGYEINLPALHTQALLERLWAAGDGLKVMPYGIEALMILRTEKGYLHIGADTDGTTLPADVGMHRGIAKKAANFVGRRSLLRPAASDAKRMQLVGLVPLDRRTQLPVGAHAAAHAPPAAIEGFVTSSCFSAALQHPVALAMLARGHARVGERITVWHLGQGIAAEVTTTPFYDPQGQRIDGQA
jgi:sarcosine oxidase, subunit alpha